VGKGTIFWAWGADGDKMLSPCCSIIRPEVPWCHERWHFVKLQVVTRYNIICDEVAVYTCLFEIPCSIFLLRIGKVG